VCEVLSELELPYRLLTVGHRSARRAELVRRAGRMQVPFLVDPAEGVELLEAAWLVGHLEARYRRPAERRVPA